MISIKHDSQGLAAVTIFLGQAALSTTNKYQMDKVTVSRVRKLKFSDKVNSSFKVCHHAIFWIKLTKSLNIFVSLTVVSLTGVKG
jgi:hypothetical protein